MICSTVRWPTDPQQFRTNNFDFIRFTLASAVILSHSYPLTLGNDRSEPLFRLTQGGVSFGSLAVDGFFIASGFLIAHSWIAKPRLGDFLRKRIARIYPGFILAVAIGFLLVMPISTPAPTRYFQPRSLLTILIRTATLRPSEAPDSFAANPYPGFLNGSLWTIHFEFICYLLLAALGMCGVLLNRGRLLAIFLALWTIHVVVDFLRIEDVGGPLHLLFYPNGGLIRLATHFLAGAAFYSWRDRIPRSGAIAAFAVTLLAASIIRKWMPEAALPICGTYLLFFFAYGRYGLEKWGARGDFSYGIYLYAFPIQQLLVMKAGIRSPLLLFAAAFPLSVVAGALSWYLVERRFLRRARRNPPSGVNASELQPPQLANTRLKSPAQCD